MLTNKEAQSLFNDANDTVREMVQRMILVIENENPAHVDDVEAMETAANWELERFSEMLDEARQIIEADMSNIRGHDKE